MNKTRSLRLGFDIFMESGIVPRPTDLKLWDKKVYSQRKSHPPFLYKADALVGLSLLHLLKEHTPIPQQKSLVASAWNEWEPHHELYHKARQRVLPLRRQRSPNSSENAFSEKLDNCLTRSFHEAGVDLEDLCQLLDHIEELESEQKKNLLFQFDLQLPGRTLISLMHLHSFLFHLRSLIAIDYNGSIQDPSVEALKLDAIADYLPHSDYTANDAVLFREISNMLQGENPEKMEKIHRVFHRYSHSGAALIENLPANFVAGIPEKQLPDALYLAQMDWLFGAESGILFRIREELYGIREGYESIFWKDLAGKPVERESNLSVDFEISEVDLFSDSRVA